MKMHISLPRAALVAGGFALALAAIALAQPASAQAYNCPPGYGYANGYGCVPISPVYDPPVYAYPPQPYGQQYYGPPVYDTFGLNFGIDLGGTRGDYRREHRH
jgi:hypothetical protein